MFKLRVLCVYLLYNISILHFCEAYKVLVLFPLARKSHMFLGDGVVRHLLDAGHEVTYITSFPKNQNHSLLREVHVRNVQELSTKFSQDVHNIEKLMKGEVDLRGLTSLVDIFLKFHVAMFEDERVLELLNDEKEQFDIVVIEWMFLELYSGIAAIFNCPYIWVSTFDPHWMVLKLIDEVPNPAFTAGGMSGNVAPFSFVQRAQELMNVAFGLTYQYFYVSGVELKAYEKMVVPIIRKRGHKVPEFEELRYNASLILGNSHVSIGTSIHLPQNYKAIGGYHINSNVEPLPQELKNILDEATNGVIYFSMGSNLPSKYIPATMKADLIKMFGRLKQTILWKIEEEVPNKPSNLHIVNWAPQQSILAHPNCVLFITHGGILSVTEAIHFGKPIIGIPVFADQFKNINNAVHKGFAMKVDLSLNTANELEKAIIAILADRRFSAKAKEWSLVYHDRPVTPGKELAHWVEHVVKTRGAPHLRSPALLLSWYQKCYLDLAILLIITLYAVTLLIRKLIRNHFKTQKKIKTH